MASALLIDTDVLIDYLRGQPRAVRWLERCKEPLCVSAVSVAELYAGVRDGEERGTLDTFISAFEVLPLDESIAVRGGLIRRDFGKSHGIGLADALIAATAHSIQATLVTLNRKHFPMLDSVQVPYRK